MLNSRKIKSRMYELGLTQFEVAKMMSLDYSTFNLKINNKRRIYVDEVTKLSKILKLNSTEELEEYFGLDFLLHESCENETKNTQGGA